MIDKKIHYVWMGKGEKSELIKRCIDSWKKYLPDYELTEWNEENFDIESNRYVCEAYKNKKWAFVSDYIRLYVLYNCGGVYFDTDVEVLKPFDNLLCHGAFGGFESKEYLSTSVMGACKNHPWIKELIQYYDTRSFFTADGNFDYTPNVVNITQKSVFDYGLKMDNRYQVLKDDLHIYPKDYFCPSDYSDNLKRRLRRVTNNSYCIHHYNGSWLTLWGKLKVKIKGLLSLNSLVKR